MQEKIRLKKPDSIAFVRTEYLGLSETFIYEEITRLKKFDSVVFTHKTENLEVFPHSNIVVLNEGAWKLDFARNLSLRRPFDSVKKLKHFWRAKNYYQNLIKKYNIRVLHAEFGPEGVYALPIKESFNLPLVTSFRGYDLSSEPRRSPGIYDRLFQVGDLFLFRSKSMIEDAVNLGCPKEKCRVHHSALDLTKFPFSERWPVEKGEPVKILFVGRFVEKKGPLTAVEVFSKLKRKYGKIQLTMIGDGSLFSDTKSLVKELGLEDDVKLLGYRPHTEVIKEMLSSHIFFMPFATAENGDKEGIPNSVKEASATGLPVASTFHSGVPEAVIDGKTGLLAKEKDVDGLVEKLSFFIENPDVWADFGKAGRKLMEEEFDIVKETGRLEGFYDKLLGRT